MMTPTTEADLAEAIAAAKTPFKITGGGTRPIGNPVAGDALSTSALSGVTLYEPGALTMVVQAGTPLAEIETALAGEKQRLAFEPMDHRGLLGTDGTPTIGGIIAANVSGPRRVQSGAARDFLLGVRFVDGMGTVLKNGGRVMKNVTGYDLVKLLCGSYGTLGVLTEVSLKVLPATETTATLVFDGLSDVDAVAAMSAALGSPFEVTGAAHAPNGPDGSPATMIRIEGFETSVTYRAGELQKLLANFGTARIYCDPAAVARQWQWVRDVEAFHGADGDVWRISCKPSDGPDLAAKLNAIGLVYDWGGGLIWARVLAGTDVRATLAAFDGHATLVRAEAGTRAKLGAFHPQPAPLAAVTAGLKSKFDPRGLLNPGLMG